MKALLFLVLLLITGCLPAQSKINEVKNNALIENGRMTLDGRQAGGWIEKEQLEYILGVVPEFAKQDSFLVKSYEIDIICKGTTFHIKNNGVLIVDSAKVLFQYLKPFDKVKFYDFTLLNGSVLKHDTIEFMISGLNVQWVLYELKEYFLSSGIKDDLSYLSSEIKNYQSYLYYFDLNKSPIIHISNCSCFSDTCSVYAFRKMNKGQKVVYVLRYKGLNGIRIEIFKDKTLLADIGYNDELLNGVITIFYENGKKRIEGEFVKYKLNNEDTITLIHPSTLTEYQQIRPTWVSMKTGVWKFYNPKGSLILSKKIEEESFYK